MKDPIKIARHRQQRFSNALLDPYRAYMFLRDEEKDEI